jgi:hypothetical protein
MGARGGAETGLSAEIRRNPTIEFFKIMKLRGCLKMNNWRQSVPLRAGLRRDRSVSAKATARQGMQKEVLVAGHALRIGTIRAPGAESNRGKVLAYGHQPQTQAKRGQFPDIPTRFDSVPGCSHLFPAIPCYSRVFHPFGGKAEDAVLADEPGGNAVGRTQNAERRRGAGCRSRAADWDNPRSGNLADNHRRQTPRHSMIFDELRRYSMNFRKNKKNYS